MQEMEEIQFNIKQLIVIQWWKQQYILFMVTKACHIYL